MNCPICGRKMEKGGIIANGIAMWHPLRECKIPNAWYCASCNKVAGIFDITDAE